MTAVIEATLPITTIALEVLVFRTQALQWRTACGVATGFLGVVLLLFHNGALHLPVLPCIVPPGHHFALLPSSLRFA
jgi:drug/metabolite transporter (DMT)-like permease